MFEVCNNFDNNSILNCNNYIVPLIFGTKTTTIQGNRIENTTITEEKIDLTKEE